MKFSIYSELQWWPGKEPAQVYAEVLEQIENADRLGFDTYSAIEHFFFPKFSASPDPIALFAAAAQRAPRIDFRTLVHVLPYHNPMVLASRIAFADVLHRRPLRVRRRPRATAGSPGARASTTARWSSATTSRWRSSSPRSSSGGEPFSYDGTFYKVHDARIVPPPTRQVPRVHGRDERQDVHPRGVEGLGRRRPAAACRTRRCASSSTCTARSAPSTATSRTSSGSTPATWTRIATPRCARPRPGLKGFLAGNASPLVEHERPPADELTEAGYGFYTAGILEKLAETPYDEMVAGDIVWVGTPEDVIERIEAVRDVCEGLTEISITVNPGGFDHWQAIKNQELFAHRVMPHFRSAGKPAASVTA